jgi:hypothetical protein
MDRSVLATELYDVDGHGTSTTEAGDGEGYNYAPLENAEELEDGHGVASNLTYEHNSVM